jgi:hypothetical protein
MHGHIDTCYIDWGSLRYRVDIDPDDDAKPAEFDCYDDEDITAFRVGHWQYVNVTVTVECPGIDITDHLGAVEYGTMPNTTIDVERLLNEYPVPDMILTCRHLLADLRSRLGAVALTEPDLLMVPVSVAEARTLHNALDLANNHWDEALRIAEAGR